MTIESMDTTMSRSEEIAIEQAYFDAAAEARDVAAAERSVENWSAGTAAERRAFQRAFDSSGSGIADANIAFGRMDLDDGEVYYVGRQRIYDAEKQLLVINWQAPAATAYNQATAGNPNGLLRKRAFTAENNRILDFHDTVFKELAAAVAELEQWESPDDALLDALSTKRSGQMTDIVRTIQAAQDKIVRMDKDRLLIVQGGPGTGKTAVALHRVSWILFNYQDEIRPQDVLVVGPNPTFTRYIRRVLPDLGDNDVVQRSLPEMLAHGVKIAATEPDDVAAVKGSAMMADLVAAGLNDRIREPKTPVRVQMRLSGRYIEIPAASVTELIRHFRSEPYLDGRLRLRAALMELANAELRIPGKLASANRLDPKSLESAVNSVWPQLSAPQFVRELLGSRDRIIRAAADTDLRASDVSLLHRPMASSISGEPWTLADLALIDEATEAMQGEQELFQHIVVDEAQDLSEMQLMAIRRRSRKGSMTIVGDIAQSTGPTALDSWDRVTDFLRSSLPAETVELEHGYRVPREVFALAEPVLKVAAPSVAPPTVIRSAGEGPQFTSKDPEQLHAELAKIVLHHSGRGRFVGVIAVEEQWDDIRAAFRAEDIQWSESTSGDLSSAINLVTPEASKGLEFDAVIVVDPQSVLDRPHGERLLYIALTRTTTRLDIIYPSGRLPEILGETATQILAENEPDQLAGVEVGVSLQQTAGVGSSSEMTPIPEAAEPESIPQASMDTSAEPLLTEPSLDLKVDALQSGAVLSPIQQQMVKMAAQLFAKEMSSAFQPEIRSEVLKEIAQILELN